MAWERRKFPPLSSNMNEINKRNHGQYGRYPTKPPPWKYKDVHIWTENKNGSSSTCRTISLSMKHNDDTNISYPTTTRSGPTPPHNRPTSRQPTRPPKGDAPLTPSHNYAIVPPPCPLIKLGISPSPGPYRHTHYGTRHDSRHHEHKSAHHTPARHPSDCKQHPTTHPSDSHVIATHRPKPHSHYDRRPSDIHHYDSSPPVLSDIFEDTHHITHHLNSYKLNPISLSTATPPSSTAGNEHSRHNRLHPTFLHSQILSHTSQILSAPSTDTSHEFHRSTRTNKHPPPAHTTCLTHHNLAYPRNKHAHITCQTCSGSVGSSSITTQFSPHKLLRPQQLKMPTMSHRPSIPKVQRTPHSRRIYEKSVYTPSPLPTTSDKTQKFDILNRLLSIVAFLTDRTNNAPHLSSDDRSQFGRRTNHRPPPQPPPPSTPPTMPSRTPANTDPGSDHDDPDLLDFHDPALADDPPEPGNDAPPPQEYHPDDFDDIAPHAPPTNHTEHTDSPKRTHVSTTHTPTGSTAVTTAPTPPPDTAPTYHHAQHDGINYNRHSQPHLQRTKHHHTNHRH